MIGSYNALPKPSKPKALQHRETSPVLPNALYRVLICSQMGREIAGQKTRMREQISFDRMVLAQTYTNISANNFDFDAVGKSIITKMLKAP